MEKFFLTIVTIFLCTILLPACAKEPHSALEADIKNLIKDKNCTVGLSVIYDDNILTIGNKKQPLLSVFKIFIALKVLNDNTNLDKILLVQKSMIDFNTYSPMLKKYNKFPIAITIRDLLSYMLSQSDNNATDILLEYIGGPKNVQKYLKDTGFGQIVVSVNEKEMNADINKQYLNKAHSKDIARMIKLAHKGKLLSKQNTRVFNQLMIQTTTGNDKLKAGLPDSVVLGHKTGSSSRKPDGTKIADNDAGFVILPDDKTPKTPGIYYIAVLITDSKLTDAENASLIAEISRLVYEYISNKKSLP